jgi:hypothetical protein
MIPNKIENPLSQRAAKVIREEVKAHKERKLAIRNEDAQLDKIIEAKEAYALGLETDGMTGVEAARWIRHQPKK